MELSDPLWHRKVRRVTSKITLDLSNTSNAAGTEISGALGFDLFSMLEIKIDYRDGPMDFVYRDNHGVAR